MLTLPPALAAMGNYPQFILYKLVPRADGKTDKLPCDWRTGQLPPKGMGGAAIWTDATTALAMAAVCGDEYGAGFSFAASDPFWFLDIDNCLVRTMSSACNGATYAQMRAAGWSDAQMLEHGMMAQAWSQTALDLCAALPGCAIEVSQSGTGLHLFGTGSVPAHGCKNTALGLEFYNEGRFVALTGNGAVGDCRTDASTALATLIPKHFPPSSTAPTGAPDSDWTTGPCAEWRGPADDDELLRRMFAAKPSTSSLFGGKATVSQLWDRDVSALSVSYPSASATQPFGESEADAALASHLAWWTGKDMERIKRLMLRSGLKRDKYERDDYIERTIIRSCRTVSTVYAERPLDTGDAPLAAAVTDPVDRNVIPTTSTGRLVNGHTFLNADDQLKLWAGFTYVTDANVILTSTGQQLGPEQFKNRYGGSVFVMDSANDKTTDNAWLAFTHSRATRMPKVDHSAFRPDLDPGILWENEGESFVNSYRRLAIQRTKADVRPFIAHLEKLLPDRRDRQIMISYMAAVVQYPGKKFQWSPLLQGVPGNGKSLLSKCVAEAVGWRYTHSAKAEQITEKYNSWLLNKVLIIVEDVYTPHDKSEIFETLKPMITDRRQPIRAMQRAEMTMDVCANFILNSNHKDAIRKTDTDRRICPLFTAQQSKDDMKRDGMDKAYFSALYGWLDKGGYAAVSEYLATYDIPAEFGLSCLLSMAPDTSSTSEALSIGMGRVEQEVMECVASGAMGFSNGWISSLALDRMLKEQRMDLVMPRAKRRAMLRTLGYDHHPGLRDGRSTVSVPGTYDKPVFFIRTDHHAAGLTRSADIMKAYIEAQQPGAVNMGAVSGEAISA